MNRVYSYFVKVVITENDGVQYADSCSITIFDEVGNMVADVIFREVFKEVEKIMKHKIEKPYGKIKVTDIQLLSQR